MRLEGIWARSELQKRLRQSRRDVEQVSVPTSKAPTLEDAGWEMISASKTRVRFQRDLSLAEIVELQTWRVMYQCSPLPRAAPFCLELHSDKANKRDTLSRIGNAARVGRTMTEPPNQVEQQFRSLLTLRRELNDYARALHSSTIFEKTPFQIHGELARRAEIPNVAASINIPVEELTSEKEISLLRQARRLSQMPEMLVNYHSHPWFRCKIDTWSMEVQTDLGAHLQRFKEALTEIDELLVDLASTIGAEKPDSTRRGAGKMSSDVTLCELPDHGTRFRRD